MTSLHLNNLLIYGGDFSVLPPIQPSLRWPTSCCRRKRIAGRRPWPSRAFRLGQKWRLTATQLRPRRNMRSSSGSTWFSRKWCRIGYPACTRTCSPIATCHWPCLWRCRITFRARPRPRANRIPPPCRSSPLTFRPRTTSRTRPRRVPSSWPGITPWWHRILPARIPRKRHRREQSRALPQGHSRRPLLKCHLIQVLSQPTSHHQSRTFSYCSQRICDNNAKELKYH